MKPQTDKALIIETLATLHRLNTWKKENPKEALSPYYIAIIEQIIKRSKNSALVQAVKEGRKIREEFYLQLGHGKIGVPKTNYDKGILVGIEKVLMKIEEMAR